MLVKFLNSDSTVSTAIAGSYFNGKGWTGGSYDAATGMVTFNSADGLGFSTSDLRGSSGPHNHEINDVTGLQAVLTAATDTLATLQAEISEARANQLAISTFAGSNAGGIVSGRYYDNATSSTNGANYNSAANRVDMCVFLTSLPLTVDQIGFSIATSGSDAYGRAFIYECGANGWPSNLLYESNTNLDLNTNSFRGETLASPFTFEANRIYWVGWRFGAASTYAVMRGLASTSMPNLGLGSSAGNVYCSVIRRSIPFDTPMPATWDFAEIDLTGGTAGPSIRMRAV